MKTKLFFVILFSAQLALYSQDDDTKTLFGKGMDFGYFGSAVSKVGKINNETGVLGGVHAGIILDHSINIGLAYYGLMDHVSALAPNPNDSAMNKMNMGYGGLEFEYVVSSNNLLHWSVQTLIGGGGSGYSSRGQDFHRRFGNNNMDLNEQNDLNLNPNGQNKTHVSFSGFFVFEPGVNVELNVTGFFRFGIGASYRLVTGLSSTTTTNSNLSGLNGLVTFKFGKF